MMNRTLHLCLLLLEGIGQRRLASLLEHFGSVENIFSSKAAEVASVASIPHKKAEELLSQHHRKKAERVEEICAEHSINIITFDDRLYPPLLRQISSPPLLLFVRGDAKLLSTPQIGVVGTRKPSNYGKRVAADFASRLASLGLVVTSGLALGIDGVAHRAALKATKPTVAVLPTGCERIYPPEHKTLAKEILDRGGALVSELPPGTSPRRENFPARNRIISGLSLGVLVVEAPERSGALITASHAIEQNREVFAVPARIDDINSTGALRLIQKGAKLVTSVRDILEELPPFSTLSEIRIKKADTTEKEEDLNDDERKIKEALASSILDASTVAKRTGLPVQRVVSLLLRLQLKGIVSALPGNQYELKR